MSRGKNDQLALAIAWAAYSVPFLAAYGDTVICFLQEWKEMAGAFIGVFGAVWVANMTNRRNTENAKRQTEAVLLRGEYDDLIKDIQSLRRHSIATHDYHQRLATLIERFRLGSEETRHGSLEKLKKDFCDAPLPKELDYYNIENDPRGLTEDILTNVRHLHNHRQQLSGIIYWALVPNNLAEIDIKSFEIASKMATICTVIDLKIRQRAELVTQWLHKNRTDYAEARKWDHA